MVKKKKITKYSYKTYNIRYWGRPDDVRNTLLCYTQSCEITKYISGFVWYSLFELRGQYLSDFWALEPKTLWRHNLTIKYQLYGRRTCNSSNERFLTLIKLYIKHFCWKLMVFAQKLFYSLKVPLFYGFMENNLQKVLLVKKRNLRLIFLLLKYAPK